MFTFMGIPFDILGGGGNFFWLDKWIICLNIWKENDLSVENKKNIYLSCINSHFKCQKMAENEF